MAEQRVQDQARSGAPPPALAALIERFDPEVIDVPSGTARIRLVVRGEREWDAVISSKRVELAPLRAPTTTRS